MITVNIYGADYTFPARYSTQARFADGRLDDAWSNDKAFVLSRFKDQIQRNAKAVIAFDFVVGEELGVFFADDGLTYDEIRQASDEAIERAMDALTGRT